MIVYAQPGEQDRRESVPAGAGRRRRTKAQLHALAGIVALLMASHLGCTPKQYAAQADKAAYGVIRQKQQQALGEQRRFEITYQPFATDASRPAAKELLLRGRPIPVTDRPRRPASAAECVEMLCRFLRGKPAVPPRVLSLGECLEVAFRNSRSFQDTKEGLYSSGLALANLRRKWSLPGGDLTADASSTRTMRGETTHSGTGEAVFSFAQKFANGGALTLAAGLDAATDFLGIKSTAFGSLVEVNLTQPLLRGAWRGFAYEQLYRSERDFAYAILQYERFTQTFATDLASRYYRVLQRRDELQNDMDNFERLRQQAKLHNAQVELGMVRRVQADQSEQAVLRAAAGVESSGQQYRDAMDEFKVTLGLPINASVELDQRELEQLKLLAIPFGEARAIAVALRTRPDVLTNCANLRDADRDAEIAADQFNPALDLELNISATGTEPRKPFRSQLHRHTRWAALSFDYNLDQTDNRDNYRNALIALEKAERDLAEFLDNVRLQVRRSYRALVRSERQYNIQKRAVALANRRTKLARLEQKEGLASTRDVLEAEDDLRSSKNDLTAALVSYTTTRLNFLADLGMISVDEKGQIHERKQPFTFDRLQLERR